MDFLFLLPGLILLAMFIFPDMLIFAYKVYEKHLDTKLKIKQLEQQNKDNKEKKND